MKPHQDVLSVCAVCLLGVLGATATERQPAIENFTLGETRNVHRCGKLFLAGQPKPGDLAGLKTHGIVRIVTLRQDGEIDWDQATAVKAQGLEFINVPFRAPSTLTDEVFDRIRGLLRETAKKPTLLHQNSSNDRISITLE